MDMHNFYQRPSGILISTPKITDTTTNRIFRHKNSSAALFIFFLLIFFFPKNINAQCTAVETTACDSLINLSIDQNCTAVLDANIILTSMTSISTDCQAVLKVALKDLNDQVITTGTQITLNANDFVYPDVGDQFRLQVFFDLNMDGVMDGNEMGCWGLVNIEDKLPPIVGNCNDVTVYCYEDISPTGNVVPQPTFTDNCSLINLTPSILDTIVEFNCHAPGFTGPFDVRAEITRTYTATDASGNMTTCSQLITVRRLPLVATNVTAPANVSLECNNTNPPDTSALNTGYPTLTFDNNGTIVTIELNPSNLSGYCSDLIVTYEDTPLNVTGCVNQLKEKYIREFTILDCCNNVIVNNVFQTISILDTTAPSITCPAALTVSSSTNSCLGNVFLPTPTTSDDCSNVTVSVTTPNGVLSSNGNVISNLPLGITTVIYTATDECGNTASCTMDVTVQDLVLPTTICDAQTVVALNNTGMGIVFADVFDDGSYDNCGPITFEVRRMADNCNSPNNLIYRPYIEVCCADIGTPIMVQMQVVDAGGNTSSCMVELEVQDKMDPIIVCPGNKTISCSDDYTDFNLTGQAIGFDNCGTATITHTDAVNVDPQCGVGTVIRIWTATDDAGRTSSCVQTITIENPSPFTGDTNPLDTDDIQWPADLIDNNAITCVNYLSDPSLTDPSNTGEPVIIGAVQGCDMVLTAIPVDMNFINNGEGKILRMWTVIDWCQYNPTDPSAGGSWTHTQTIKVTDLTAPVFINPPVDFTVDVGANCESLVTIPTINQSDISDCSSNVTISVSGDLGSGNSATVGVGDYTITYTLTDAAGNSTFHNITVTVDDAEDPVVVCQNLSAPLMLGVNTLTLPARDFLSTSTTDNCTAYDDLSVAIIFANQVTNGPPSDPDITFTCDHRGVNNVILWVCDESNNCFSCTATMTITDPSNSCPILGAMADISGVIDNEFGEGIEDVEVRVSNGQMDMTGANGNFMIEDLPLNESYTFSPEKNTDHRNGVTTFDMVLIQRHILGNEFLDSPYKIIAADANVSGTITTFDLVILRNLILQNIDEFPNDVPSWRFIDGAYDFPDPTDPFTPDFPEEYVIPTLTEDMTDMNFVSVKVGDVNGSALPALTSSDTRERVGELIFTADDQLIQKGEIGIFRLNSEDIQNLEAWQFSLTFETHYLQILNVEKNENVFIGNSMLEDGAITACWNNNEMERNKNPWLQIQFLAKEDIYLSDVIELNSDYTNAEAYNVGGELYDVTLHFNLTDNSQKGKEFILYQNSPNPFTDETIISFHLPEPDFVHLKVYNISGELIYDLERYFEAGQGMLNLSSKMLSSSGMLYYTIETNKYHATKRMILLNK